LPEGEMKRKRIAKPADHAQIDKELAQKRGDAK
jgi:hypothetical protein